jgi:FkbM family methyltransferase
MIRQAYRLAAAACAEAVWRMPVLERPFIGFGRLAWELPGAGRFYRSAAHRLGERMRRAGSPFRRIAIGNVSLVLDVTEFTTSSLYFGGAPYEPETAEYFAQTLGPGHVFVDIGANHGYFAMLAAALVGDAGRVIAFEPNPQVFRQLKMHVALNGFEPRVLLMPSALADAPGEAKLYVSQEETNSGLSSLAPGAEALAAGSLSEAHTVSVPLDTFDRWLAASAVDRVDLVKIDVEGAESRVLAGMSSALNAGKVDAIVCETEWDGPFHRAICGQGFSARRLDSIGALENVVYTSPTARGRR